MDALVMNTLTGAVSEYTNFAFNSITPNYAASAAGLVMLSGNTDAGAVISADVATGRTLIDSQLKKRVEEVNFSLAGAGNGVLVVYGKASTWTYTFPIRASGQSRSIPGQGIRENYLAFGFRNVAGADFKLDRIDAILSQSTTRKV